MRVGLVRNAAFGMVALVGVGLAGCDDNPTDFDTGETVKITVNPTTMSVEAGNTALLESRTENAGNEPTWENVEASVDGSCGPGAITVAVPDDFLPDIQPPGLFEVTGGTTLGATCVELQGGGESATVDVTVVADTLVITGAVDTLNINESVDLGAVLQSGDGADVAPFDENADVEWSTDNEEVLPVDDDGVVTAAGVGGGLITASWEGFGVERESSVAIAINSPTLEIGDLPEGDSVLIFTSHDLSVELVNPTDPPEDFGPFDENTDVTWSSSDEDVMSVDEATGEVTAEGAGTATITVEWNENTSVFATVDLSTDIPAPELTSTDVASADALDVVTITGSDFIPGAHTVLIGGEEPQAFYETEVVDPTTATFVMPGGAAEDVEVSVGIVGIESNALTVGRTCGASDESCATEPENNDIGEAPAVTLPVDIDGIVDGSDLDDFFTFTLAAETTLQLDLAWTGDSGDMDLLIADPGFTAEVCGFVTATADVPESGECTLEAGDYLIDVNSFDEEVAVYELDIVEVP